MSHHYPPANAHASSSVAGGRPAPPHTRRTRRSHSRQDPDPSATPFVDPSAFVAGSAAHSALYAHDDLKIVKNDFQVIFEQIRTKMSQCQLTKAQEKLREYLYEDIFCVRDLIMAVLRAHRGVATAIRQVILHPAQHGPYPDVQMILSPANTSIDVALTQFSNVTTRLQDRSKALKESSGSGDVTFRSICQLLVNWNIPQIGWAVGLGLGVAAPTWNATHTAPEVAQMTSTKAVQLLLSVGAVVLGPTVGSVIGYIGREAPINQAEVLRVTKGALVSIHQLLKQLSDTVGDLTDYWGGKYHRRLEKAMKIDPNMLLSIAQLMDQHVDDCLVMVSAIHRNISSPGEIPTTGELFRERVQQRHGVPPMLPYPNRNITYGGGGHHEFQ